jgi:hypothetical protein
LFLSGGAQALFACMERSLALRQVSLQSIAIIYFAAVRAKTAGQQKSFAIS